MNKIRIILTLIMLCMFTVMQTSNATFTKNYCSKLEASNDSIRIADSLESIRIDSIRTEKICAVRDFMHKSAKNQGYSINKITLTPEAIVTACESENFDIPFVMAAAKLESCFGLSERAVKTNSVFAVGCYDNGKDYSFYDTQDECIVPYIQLLKNQYLGENKTILDILKPGCFVNFCGRRYASNVNYERQMASIRNSIIKSYPILLD
jgi:uncharacterized FlgJ-related protein